MLMEVLSLHPWTGRLLSVWFGPISGGVPARQHWGSSRLLFGLVARALAAALVGHTRAADRRHRPGTSDPPLSSKETEDRAEEEVEGELHDVPWHQMPSPPGTRQASPSEVAGPHSWLRRVRALGTHLRS